MGIEAILKDLYAERDRLVRAISALEGAGTRQAAGTKRRRKRFSAATRQRMSEMMKKRWAARKKAARMAA